VRWVRRHWVLSGLAALLALFLITTARLFIWPPTDEPSHVDAIVALGGDAGQRRAKYALELATQGYAPVVVVSLGGYPPAPCPRAPDHVRVVCFRANPLNTRGEAEHASRLAAENHWQRLMVVPSRIQATRARLLFNRCTSVDLTFVPVGDPLTRLPLEIAYEWGALAKALVVKRSC